MGGHTNTSTNNLTKKRNADSSRNCLAVEPQYLVFKSDFWLEK